MLNITLQKINGESISLQASQYDTPRHILSLNHISEPQNSKLFLFVHKRQLLLDFSFKVQGVQNNDYITMVIEKLSKIRQKGKYSSNLVNIQKPIFDPEHHDKEIFEEAIKVSDIGFLLIDSSISESAIYKQMYESQKEIDASNSAEEDEAEIPTIIEPASEISIQALPPCW